ncbi:MAG: hypothetical protein JXB29_10685 [Sedimentisphaerales bacterium]|nr:hypothetical protein [Sedimentisphaerales bacterium]
MILTKKRKGSAIVLVVLAVVILSTMGIGLLKLSQDSRIFAIRNTQGIKARCAADAGLAKAVFEMNEKLQTKPWDDSILPKASGQALPNTAATFGYEVTLGDDIGDGIYTIESTGIYVQATKKTYATIDLVGIFDHAILTREMLTMKAGTLIDGYNSSDAGDTDVELKIGTISILPDQLILNSGIVVDGDVFVGVDGIVDVVIKDLGADTGMRTSLTEEPFCPVISPPALSNKGKIDVKGTTETMGPSDSGKYSELKVADKGKDNPGIVEIDGGEVVLHITGDIDMGTRCEIKIKPDSSLIIYVDGDVQAGNSDGFNNETCIPSSLKIYGNAAGSQRFDIKAKSNVFGALYAPQADIILRAQGDVYGAVTANSFEMKSGNNFYYDEALRNVDLDDEGVRFVIKRWREE